jgi:hypothetical protein
MSAEQFREGEVVYLNCTKEPWKATVLKIEGPLATVHVPASGQILQVPLSVLYR